MAVAPLEPARSTDTTALPAVAATENDAADSLTELVALGGVLGVLDGGGVVALGGVLGVLDGGGVVALGGVLGVLDGGGVVGFGVDVLGGVAPEFDDELPGGGVVVAGGAAAGALPLPALAPVVDVPPEALLDESPQPDSAAITASSVILTERNFAIPVFPLDLRSRAFLISVNWNANCRNLGTCRHMAASPW